MRRVRSQFRLSVSRLSVVGDRRVSRGGVGVLAVVGALLAFAPSAGASLGVANFFGNPSSAAGVLGGQFSTTPAGVAVNDASGDLYVVDSGNHRVQQFDEDGVFLRAWGVNVSNAAANEIQAVMVNATGGQFRLTFGADTTVDLAANVPASGGVGPAASIENALNALSSVSTFGGSVSVSGGPGGPGGATPYLVTFKGSLAGTDVAAMTATAGTVPLSGGSGVGADAATVSTFAPGGEVTTSFEVCEAAASCRASGAAATGGGMNTPRGIAVDQQTGHVYVTSHLLRRVDQFDARGNFIRAWGQDVIASGPHDQATGYEVCTAADVCKAGVAAGTGGAFAGTTGNTAFNGRPAVVPAGGPNAGNVVVSDPMNSRVQEFTSAGGFVRAFGADVETGGTTGFEVCTAAAACKAGTPGNAVGQFEARTPSSLAVDTTGAVYTVEAPNNLTSNNRVQKFTPQPGPAALAPSVFAADLLSATGSSIDMRSGSSPLFVAVDPSDDHVFVAKGEITALDGLAVVAVETRVVEVDSAGGLVDTHMAGASVNMGVIGGIVNTPVTGLAVRAGGGPVSLTSNTVAPRVYVLGEVPEPGVSVAEASGVTADSAVLHATVDPARTTAGLRTYYRFEYSKNGFDWVPAQGSDVDLGNGSGAGDPESCPVGNPPSCQVSFEVDGLDPDREYRVRVIARTEFNGATVTVPGSSFRTLVSPPAASAGVALWSSPPDSDPTLLLTGQVNPRGSQATYRFEYVTQAAFEESGFEAASRAPVTDADLGRGVASIAVQQSVSGLDPAVPYRYRLVATNSSGSTDSVDRGVAPPDDGDRFYELVSDGDSWGAGTQGTVHAVSDDGERAQFRAQGFGQPDSVPGPAIRYTAQRGSSGWTVRPMVPEPGQANGSFSGEQSMTTPDLGTTLWPVASRLQRVRGEVGWEQVRLDGSRTPLTEMLAPVDWRGGDIAMEYRIKGATPDLSSFVFSPYIPQLGSGVRFFSDELFPQTPSWRANLYMISPAPGGGSALSVVNRGSDPSPGVPGPVIGGTCGVGLGSGLPSLGNASARGAVSRDGSVVYFTASATAPESGSCAGLPERRVFKRVNGAQTIQVSQSQCARVSPACSTVGEDEFKEASRDGSTVFFLSTRQLTDSDTDSGLSTVCDPVGFLRLGCDLYAYDADPPAGRPNLVQVSAGSITPTHPTVGSGASVVAYVGASSDGARVYFVAQGALTGANSRGVSPLEAQRNLYVYQRDDANPDGQLRFIATLPATEPVADVTDGFPYSVLPAGADGDGHVLVFTSTRALLDEDTDAVADVYRYDDLSGELSCVSCAGDGNFPARIPADGSLDTSQSNRDQLTRVASQDLSSIVFTTSESLVSADTNTAPDAYLWRSGELTLISGGTGDMGIDISTRSVAISSTGQSVFFSTRAPLVASDVNRQTDMYVARVGGGFPAAGTPGPECEPLADDCQGQGSGAVSSSPTTGTTRGVASAGERLRLSLRAPTASARRRATRSGVLVVGVRSSRAGAVRLVARANIGRRVRVVGSTSRKLAKPGAVSLRIQLSRAARRSLRSGRSLRVIVQARSAGARTRSIAIRLPGASS